MNDRGDAGHEADRTHVRFSLMYGGPFYYLLSRAHIVRPGKHDVVRAMLVIIAITWGPLAILAIAQFMVTGKVSAIARDPETHARLLLALPLLVLSEALLDARCEATLRLLVEKYVDPHVDVAGIVRQAERLRDAIVPEAFLLMAAVASGQTFLWGMSPQSGLFRGMPTEGHLSWPLFWFGVVALPLFNFFLFRLLYRWAIWCSILVKFAFRGVRPLVTHPDLAGGLGCTTEPIGCFAATICASSIVLSAHWAYRIREGGIDIATLAPDFVVFVTLALAIALGPLVAFTPRLWRSRLDGLEDYNRLANVHSSLFDEKWIIHREGSPVGTPDISSLADLGSSYERIERMRLVPFGRRAPLLVVGAALGPLLPLATVKVPFPQLIASLGRALLGGMTP